MRHFGGAAGLDSPILQLRPGPDTLPQPPPGLLAEEEGAAHRAGRAQKLGQPLRAIRVEVRRGLVEQNRPRARRQGRSEGHPLALAGGELGDASLCKRVDAEALGYPVEIGTITVEATGGLELLGNRRQKELSVRTVEAGSEEMGALTGVEVGERLAREDHVSPHLGPMQPGDEP